MKFYDNNGTKIVPKWLKRRREMKRRGKTRVYNKIRKMAG